MKILVTGFDPFGQDTMNPAIEAVKRLPDTISGAEIIKLEIPTVFNKSAEVTREAMAKHDVDYVLNIGQAGGRFDLTPERVAINLDDARIPDNEGNQPIDVEIKADGESAYFSQHPVKAMVTAIKNAGLPASVSNTAGTFVCNHIMYQSLYLTHKEFPKAKAGFMHVPFLPEQVLERPGMPAMSLEDITRGIVAAIETIVEFDGKEDLKAIGGQTH
ncbi:pyroglutamyl-peptidase I [Vagococcus fluvialis]|uniref:Pyrrolidone-carboxylate peptidase n=1 Tax=Vagococcus fluvialis TaxID=2738 RepID=A0A369B2F9_9ENTE|nr:pyroglutamyl-peptidase I [Vagococcus fluvialis]MBO0478915.1 pyroglutamyl-peptidase I [Vagococcus fluvialis]MBO0483989.1 pyroglutamyl-peptidase I [Vagococcus fluvialis]MBO0486104.1 pyroglutamyl-peptidase I [Vagococcus fluvialis]MDT2746320.1 pyroglutamyl-peptidase I [Vagococcus fluvialis]NKC59912.1 pyroglutamyl-peptidase I [Vagococcus fluvialis]